jgi:benzaldehyde dehydrogenase (NAD)
VSHCKRVIDDTLAKGAKLVCGVSAETTLMPATALDHVTPQMLHLRRGDFCPVKRIVRVNCTACANDDE